jgi:hypothetical protein
MRYWTAGGRLSRTSGYTLSGGTRRCEPQAEVIESTSSPHCLGSFRTRSTYLHRPRQITRWLLSSSALGIQVKKGKGIWYINVNALDHTEIKKPLLELLDQTLPSLGVFAQEIKPGTPKLESALKLVQRTQALIEQVRTAAKLAQSKISRGGRLKQLKLEVKMRKLDSLERTKKLGMKISKLKAQLHALIDARQKRQWECGSSPPDAGVRDRMGSPPSSIASGAGPLPTGRYDPVTP